MDKFQAFCAFEMALLVWHLGGLLALTPVDLDFEKMRSIHKKVLSVFERPGSDYCSQDGKGQSNHCHVAVPGR